MDRILEISELHFCYENRPVLQGVSLTVQPGEVVALLGPSGAGKTTLLRCIAGLLKPDLGQIQVCGQAARLGTPQIAYMVQEDLLLPWRTVLANVLLPIDLRQGIRGRIPASAKARKLLVALGLEGWEERYPHELSGGMRQRVALARTLLSEGSLYLLDEPFGSLDLIRREQLYDLLLDHCVSPQSGVLVITHDLRDALRLADRLVVMAQGTIAGQVLSDAPNAEQLVRNLLAEAVATCRS
jgi:ABC-type nitrate/sulfonate/bicarbonate transport system ATPase subunit